MFISSSENIYLKNLDADKMGGLGGGIYLKYLDTNKMRGEVETFLFPVLH